MEKKKRQDEKERKQNLLSMSRTHNKENAAFFEDACDCVIQEIIDTKGAPTYTHVYVIAYMQTSLIHTCRHTYIQ